MKNKAALIALILVVLIFQLSSLLARVGSSQLPFFNTELTLKNVTYESYWIPFIQINNLILLLLTGFTVISLILIFRKWENLKFYGTLIIKRFNFLGYLFIGEGCVAMLLYFATAREEFSQTLHVSYVSINLYECFNILTIGLLFLLISTALDKAKFIKDENDLTI